MSGDNNKDKKGFSGLSDLASEISGIDEPIKPESKAEAETFTFHSDPKPHQDTTSSEAERKTTSSPSPNETLSLGRRDGDSGGKWILGIIGIICVLWFVCALCFIDNRGQSNVGQSSNSPPSSSQSYHPQTSPAPAMQAQSTHQDSGVRYIKPNIGTNNVLSVSEIRWCVRGGIRIEAMRDVINNNEDIDKFNRIVNDYNSRCGSYRYHQGSQSRAERDVEAYRSQIVSEAIREAKQLGRSYRFSYSSVSPSPSTISAPKKPSAPYTRKAQRLLTDLGYDPGPVDGDYGRRTADAVKAFQRDVSITQDGWIDQKLLSNLLICKEKIRRLRLNFNKTIGNNNEEIIDFFEQKGYKIIGRVVAINRFKNIVTLVQENTSKNHLSQKSNIYNNRVYVINENNSIRLSLNSCSVGKCLASGAMQEVAKLHLGDFVYMNK